MNTDVHRYSFCPVCFAQRGCVAIKKKFRAEAQRRREREKQCCIDLCTLLVLLLLLTACRPAPQALSELSEEGWQHYTVYQPRIERSFVVDASTQPLRYNHDSTIAWFRDRWFCLWNANTVPREGAPGQLNYVSTSRDGITWSAPLSAFSDTERCANPVPCLQGTQWQPNLLVINDTLWALWSQASKDGHKGCYLSVLESPDGKWVNRQLSWNGKLDPVIDGRAFRLFPTQNPIRLSTGRVLAPVTMMGPVSTLAPPRKTGWAWLEKRNSVIYSDDVGATWQLSPGTVLPGLDWRQWEPTVFEQPDGSVLMFARNNIIPGKEDVAVITAETLTWSVSHDCGATWSPHAFVPLQTVISRMHVLRQSPAARPVPSDRYIMIHNDWLSGTFCADRRNLALFVNRGGGIDFVAGTALTGREYQVAYPQMFLHGDTLLASYSQGACALRNIKVVRVSPLPDPDRFYIYPRANLPQLPCCAIKDKALVINGGLSLKGRVAPIVSPDGLSCAAWVRPNAGGVFFDNRNSQDGFVWGLSGSCFVHLGEPSKNIRSTLVVARDRWNYVGVTINYAKGEVLFFVNGAYERISFKPGNRSMRGSSSTIGGANLAASSLPAFEGAFRALALYGTNYLSVAQHHTLFESQSVILPQKRATLLLDPSDASALVRDFVLPVTTAAAPESVQTAEIDGRHILRFSGGASAGIELAANERADGDAVELTFSFMVEQGGGQTICTVGDANQSARVVFEKGEILLTSPDQSRSCGKVTPGVWQQLALSTHGDVTRVTLDSNSPVELRHTPEATWIYLGEGFRSSSLSTGHSVFSIDISTVQTRVKPWER